MSNEATSIALGINFYNDAPALRGLLETAAPYFDNIFAISSGPGGARSTDGSEELLTAFGATVVFDDMQRGFGAIRTRLIHDCGCTFVMILDCDERFFPLLPVLHCEGTDRYPAQTEPNLSVHMRDGICTQGALVKELIKRPDLMAVVSIRRHWFSYSMKKPAENWLRIKDYQMRIVRNHPDIHYQTDRVMHERLIDGRTGRDPAHFSPDDYTGPFFDHFHCFERRTRPGQKEANEINYGKLERGEAMLP